MDPTPRTPGLPAQYDPDETRNYEIGLKADFLDHRLSVDTSVYYIDWQDIQLQKFADLDGRRAVLHVQRQRREERGVELSVGRKTHGRLDDLRMDRLQRRAAHGSLARPGAVVRQGRRQTPLSSKYSGSLSIDKRFPL